MPKDWRVLSDYATEEEAPSVRAPGNPTPHAAAAGHVASDRVHGAPPSRVFRFVEIRRSERALGIVGLILGTVWLLLSVADSHAGTISYLAGVAVVAGSAGYLVKGTLTDAPPLVLVVDRAALTLGSARYPWDGVAGVELTTHSLLPSGADWDLHILLDGGEVVSIPRQILGENLLGPWDDVLAAIHGCRPELQVVRRHL